MVQLSLSLSMTPPPDPSDTDDLLEGPVTEEGRLTGSKGGSPAGLEVMEETYPGYESYIEDGLICLKHKVRNLEKKKLKLEEYKKRLKRGEALNKDQMAAVEKYDEVVHNLTFAQELHRTLDGLTQNLLRSQRRAVKREQTARTETERRRLISVLQLQQVLHSLEQDRVRADLLSGLNQAPRVQVQQLQSLTQLRGLLGLKRDHTLSLKEQMENAAVLYVDLLDGKDKPVAGSTFKELKEELNVLVNSSYFSSLPPEPKEGTSEGSTYSTNDPLSKSEPPESSGTQWLKSLYLPDPVPGKTWDMDFKDLKDREPPDDWDAAYTESTPTEQPTVGKPWRGGAALIPKNQDCVKKQSEGKRKKAKKARREEHFKPSLDLEIPVEVFNSPSALPKDPVLRKQQLEDLMTKIHGAFSFMQDSVLDGDSPPSSGHHRPRRRVSGSPSPLSRSDLKSPGDPLPKTRHSTPLPMRCLDNKPGLTNGDHSLDTSDTSDLELSKDHSHEALHVSDHKAFPSPPLYCREPSSSVSIEDRRTPQSPVSVLVKEPPLTSTPPQAQSFTTPPSRRALPSTHFKNMHSVFKVNPTLPPNSDLPFTKAESPSMYQPRFTSASTQTPPEFAPTDEETHAVYPDYSAGSSGQIFQSPSQSGGSRTSHYPQRSVRGRTRGKALSYGSSGPPQPHLRDAATLYTARDGGYQQNYRRAGGRHNTSTGWSDSSQVSSPDRDNNFTILDSGQGESLSVSTVDIPLTPHPHPEPPPTAPVLPLPLYPLSQPLRIAFTASRTANFAPGNLDQPIVFDQLHSNIGDMYDTHIGRFTCPINGTYVFMFHILKLAINVPLYINLMRNEEVMVSAYANDGAPDHETASNHAILPLFQGDQVWLRLHRGAIYGSTWKYSTFSGFMLYQD